MRTKFNFKFPDFHSAGCVDRLPVLWDLHGVHLLGHPLHDELQLVDEPELLGGLLDEQPAGPGRDAGLPVRRLPDGRRGEEGLATRLLRDEPIHRVDHDDGGEPGLAALRGQVPARAGCRPRDHHLPRLHPRDHQA